MTFRHRCQRLLGLPALLGALLLSGCEATVFHFANRGLPTPDASTVYAPERELSLDIYRPRGAQAPVPVVVFFYGGAWKRGSRDQYRFVGQRLAQNGVLAIVADYRTWPRAEFPAFMDDAADAVAWARAHAGDYGGDPRRLFVAGHSAGAQIAGLLGTDARYLSAHGLQPKQLAGVIGLSGPYDFNVGREYAPVFGPPSQWPRGQTINFVDGNEPPFLLIHGQADRVVEARDSVDLDAKLRANGGRSQLVLLSGAGHSAPLAGFYNPSRAPAVLPAVLGFIRAPTP